MFSRLYKNSTCKIGTLRYFREKLQHRNVTKDVKHFFNMQSKDTHPTQNIPPFCNIHGNQKKYFDEVLEKFVDTFLLPQGQNTPTDDEQKDCVKNHSLSLLRYFFIFAAFKDAVREGNGEQLLILHKQLLHHFKSIPGFNAYAIEI